MICSEARLIANRKNAALSTGPRTAEGRDRSRQNGLKHGLTGQGLVVTSEEAEEVADRTEALRLDMKPRSPGGLILIAQLATLSVRAERAARHESAALAERVRHAADDFDEERIEEADRLFEALGEDPRNSLRKLKRTPEGVDRLLDAWQDLRDDLAIDPEPAWTVEHLERAANLTGLQARHARASRLGALSRGFWGDFAALGDGEAEDLDEGFRREWARSMLFERIDAEVAALEAHRETLDFETIELDRLGAGDRALFDPSKSANLARRYESEARRGFFKALEQFRRVEAESEAREESPTDLPAPPAPLRAEVAMGSSREIPEEPASEPSRTMPDRPKTAATVVTGADARPSRPVQTAGASG